MSVAKSQMPHHHVRHDDRNLVRTFKARAEQVTRSATATAQRLVSQARTRSWAAHHPDVQLGAVAISLATAQEVQRAWCDLQSHPALLWTPPLWRTDPHNWSSATPTVTHSERAIERNLKVELITQPNGMMQVRLMTGPLKDKPTPSGIDPLTPVAELNPRLVVIAATFEDAVLELRDAVVGEYGPSPSRR